MVQSTQDNERLLELLSAHLEECDLAKQILRDKGYGCTGMSIVETARLVPDIEKTEYHGVRDDQKEMQGVPSEDAKACP
jgi:hypothetical protein